MPGKRVIITATIASTNKILFLAGQVETFHNFSEII